MSHRSSAKFAVGVLCAVVVAGCGPTPGGDPSSAGSTPSQASASAGASTSDSPTPAIDLTEPGKAAEAVEQLRLKAEGEIVRVTVSQSTARLTTVDKFSRPHSLVWTNGVISAQDEGTDFVVSTSFDPRFYNLEDIGALFAQAAEVSGSTSRQELTIAEYANSRVLMTVSTSPESQPVFFRQDGTIIYPMDFKTPGGLRDGLREAVGKTPAVRGIGISAEQLWVDVSAGPGVVERRIRPSTVPVYQAQRNQPSKDHEFDPALIDPDVIARQIVTLPVALDKPNANVTVLIQQPNGVPEPRMYFDVGGTEVVTDLAGERISPS